MTKSDQQKVFDIVKAHLLTQGERAYNPELQICMYRLKKTDAEGNEKTLKCAAGCLIVDHAYSPGLEQITVTTESPCGDFLRATLKYSLAFQGIEVSADLNGADMLFIRKLQLVHDAEDRVQRWPVLLEQLAERFELIP